MFRRVARLSLLWGVVAAGLLPAGAAAQEGPPDTYQGAIMLCASSPEQVFCAMFRDGEVIATFTYPLPPPFQPPEP